MTIERGQYRKLLAEQGNTKTEPADLKTLWFRIRFYISLILFVCFVLWDYTDLSVRSLKSEQVVTMIRQDYTEHMNAEVIWNELTQYLKGTL